jgi:hypothetical protein
VREYLKVNKCDGVPPSRYDYAAANKALGNYIIYRHTLHQQQLNHTCKQKYKQKQQQQQQQQQQPFTGSCTQAWMASPDRAALTAARSNVQL